MLFKSIAEKIDKITSTLDVNHWWNSANWLTPLLGHLTIFRDIVQENAIYGFGLFHILSHTFVDCSENYVTVQSNRWCWWWSTRRASGCGFWFFHFFQIDIGTYEFVIFKENNDQPQIKWSNECNAPVITSRPDSAMSVLKWMRFPFCHIWISSVCPGMVGFVKRALTALNSETSLSAYANRTARTEKPSVHRPCRIGTLWPAIFEKSGSMCNGFKSPDILKTNVQTILLAPSNRFALDSVWYFLPIKCCLISCCSIFKG